MEKVCGDWYRYRFSGITSVGIVFNDGAGRQTADLVATQTNWYNNGWLGADPGITLPEANFSADPGLSGTAPFTITFNGALSTSCNGVQSYEWDFGNGQTGSGVQPTTIFTEPGNYVVTLTVTDNEGQKGSTTRTVSVQGAAAGFWVYFKKPNAWANSVKIQFTNRNPGNQSIAFPGVDMLPHCGDWYKYFFANTEATGITFSDGGANQFTGLHANQHTSFIGSRKVLGAPPAENTVFANFEITPVTGKAPLQVGFQPEASIACSGIASYFWDFGNGSNSTSATPTITYQQQGVYPVNLSVTDAQGNSHQLTKKIVVGPAEGNVIVHFRRPAGWNNVPNTYFWAPEPTVNVPGWPGTPMTDEGNGWYVFTVNGAKCANIIFNNAPAPQTPDLMNICGEQWFDNGWLSQIVPDNNLPVRLLSFTGRLQQGVAELLWKVAEEQDVSHYTLQRSTNAQQFENIHHQPARNLPGTFEYRHIDAKLPAGHVAYYRLEVQDKDGSVRFSPIVKLNLQQSENLWTAYPNPVKNSFVLQGGNNALQAHSVRLMTVQGQTLLAQKLAFGQKQVTIQRNGGWQAGVYWVELIDDRGSVIQRFKLLFD
jgi:PKD repeat protein